MGAGQGQGRAGRFRGGQAPARWCPGLQHATPLEPASEVFASGTIDACPSAVVVCLPAAEDDEFGDSNLEAPGPSSRGAGPAAAAAAAAGGSDDEEEPAAAAAGRGGRRKGVTAPAAAPAAAAAAAKGGRAAPKRRRGRVEIEYEEEREDTRQRSRR